MNWGVYLPPWWDRWKRETLPCEKNQYWIYIIFWIPKHRKKNPVYFLLALKIIYYPNLKKKQLTKALIIILNNLYIECYLYVFYQALKNTLKIQLALQN